VRSFYRATDKVFRDLVFFNICINFFLVVAVITQCIKDLRQGKMGKVNDNFFGRESQTPVFYNGPDRRSRTFNDRLSTQDSLIADNITMLNNRFHDISISYSKNYTLSTIYLMYERIHQNEMQLKLHTSATID